MSLSKGQYIRRKWKTIVVDEQTHKTLKQLKEKYGEKYGIKSFGGWIVKLLLDHPLYWKLIEQDDMSIWS